MEDEKKVVDDQTVNEDTTKENEGSSESEDVKSLLAQKKHFREKAEKLQEELESLRAKETVKVGEPDEPKVPQTNNQNSDLSAKIERLEFAQAHPEIEAGDIQQVIDLARMNGKTPEEALEFPMIKAYLASKKSEQDVASATPTGNRSPKQAPPKPVSEMSREEHKEYVQKIVGAK